MTQNPRKYAGAPVITLVMLGMAGMLGLTGCTGTDTLDLGVVQLDFDVTSTNPTAVDWDCIQLDLVSLTVTSLDGTCSVASSNPGEPCHSNVDCPSGSCDGSLSQEVLPQSIEVPIPDGKLGFQDGECPELPGLSISASANDLPSLVLSSGLYRIESLTAGDGFLLDVDDLGAPTAFGQCSGTPELAPFYGSVRTFRVGEGGITRIQLVLDLTEFEGLLVPPAACTSTLSNALEIRQIQ